MSIALERLYETYQGMRMQLLYSTMLWLNLLKMFLKFVYT